MSMDRSEQQTAKKANVVVQLVTVFVRHDIIYKFEEYTRTIRLLTSLGLLLQLHKRT